MTIKVDLLEHEKPRFSVDPLLVVLTLVTVSAAMAFTFYGQMLEQEISHLDRQRLALEGEIQQCETASKAIEQERQKLQKLEQQFRLVQSLKRDPLKFAHLLVEISRVLPDSVTLETLSIDPGPQSVSFSASTNGPMPLSLIATTMDSFNRSAYFDSSNLQSAARAQEERMRFSMTVHFDPRIAAEKPPGSQDVKSLEVSKL